MTYELPQITLSKLADILMERDVVARIVGDDVAVRGMGIDSRVIEADNLFICKGAGFRPAFLAGAIEAGAGAYLCEGVGEDLSVPSELAAVSPATPALVVDSVRRAMAFIAPAVYGNPDEQLEVVGITGTKGKSTVAYMLHHILAAAHVDSSILGSIETDDGVQRFESHNTTPEAPDLWRHLYNTVSAGRRHMVMEVSSQGLKYDRVLGLTLDIACFLNIGRDHISGVEHSSFEDYFESKLRIFEQCKTAVVNLGTDHLDEVLRAADAAGRLVTVAVKRDGVSLSESELLDADFTAANISSTAAGLAFDVRERGVSEPEHVELGMTGLFNVDNALAAIAMARLLDVDYDAIRAGLAHIRVPGRMELVASADGQTLAIVDYAHNELSFKTLFESVKAEYPERKVIALFGAPGGKAHERREALPRVAGAYAEHIIYTEEDPAHDRVEDICAELSRNTPAGVSHEVILDREEAVARAFELARSSSDPAVVLLLAKGDETTQHRGDEYPEVKSDLALAHEVLQG